MAEEPQPSSLVEGATEESTLPTNAEDRKAAAALSSLDARGDDEEETSAKSKDVDTAALNKAMKNLDVKADKADVYKGKIEAADINLVVSTCCSGYWKEMGMGLEALGISSGRADTLYRLQSLSCQRSKLRSY
jgi:hypothetical protein